MSIPVCIKNGGDNSIEARVNRYGVLAVGPLAFSSSYNAELTVDNTPVNLITPMSGQNFIITSIYVKGSKAINATTDATFTIYENGVGPTDTTQTKVILTVPVGRSESLSVSGIQVLVQQGYWLNAVATDSNINVVVFGYYIQPLL